MKSFEASCRKLLPVHTFERILPVIDTALQRSGTDPNQLTGDRGRGPPRAGRFAVSRTGRREDACRCLEETIGRRESFACASVCMSASQ